MPAHTIKIGGVVLGKGPTIVLTITDLEGTSPIRKAKRLGARILEVRLDRFRNLSKDYITQKIRSLRRLRMPLIATIRSRREGGGRSIPDSERLELFKNILPLVDAIDLELNSNRLRKVLAPLARRRSKRVILSYHNFRSTPPDSTLLKLVEKVRRGGADLIKIALTPKGKRDVARLLLFTYRNRDKNLITIAMGRRGVPSRILAPLFGSLLTYSFVGRSQAPGQLSIDELSKEIQAYFPRLV